MSTIKNLNAPVLRSEKKDEKIKLNKSDKPVRLLTKDIVLDDLFQELETTRDQEGNVVDTRFSPEIQTFVRDYLMAKNVTFDDTGYLSLRGACYNLKYDDRLELCRSIKYKFDKPVDIDNKLKSKGFFDTIKTGSSMITGGAALGTAVGLGINAVKPNMIPDKLGTIGKEIVGKEIDKSTGIFSGPIKDFTNGFIDNKILSQTLPINLVSGGLGGVALGAIGAAATSLYNIVNNCVKRVNSKKENAAFMEIDNRLYQEDNEKEARLIAAHLKEESGIEIEGLQPANSLA